MAHNKNSLKLHKRYSKTLKQRSNKEQSLKGCPEDYCLETLDSNGRTFQNWGLAREKLSPSSPLAMIPTATGRRQGSPPPEP